MWFAYIRKNLFFKAFLGKLEETGTKTVSTKKRAAGEAGISTDETIENNNDGGVGVKKARATVVRGRFRIQTMIDKTGFSEEKEVIEEKRFYEPEGEDEDGPWKQVPG